MLDSDLSRQTVAGRGDRGLYREACIEPVFLSARCRAFAPRLRSRRGARYAKSDRLLEEGLALVCDLVGSVSELADDPAEKSQIEADLGYCSQAIERL